MDWEALAEEVETLKSSVVRAYVPVRPQRQKHRVQTLHASWADGGALNAAESGVKLHLETPIQRFAVRRPTRPSTAAVCYWDGAGYLV